MVWGVCRSLIRDRHDAEDAFQATFLILVRKAGSLRVGDTLGPWIHVVAYRTALSVRTAAARRRAVERPAGDSLSVAVGPRVSDTSRHDADEVRAAIHAEIMSLPEAFRTVIVLCDLEGLSYLEAAGRLKIPLGTVQSRLARARRRLGRGLTLRGICPSNVEGANEPSGTPISGLLASGGLAPSLVGRVGRLCALIATDPTRLKTIVAGPVQAVIRGGQRTMLLGQLRRVFILCLCGSLVGGALLYTDARSGQAVPDGAKAGGRQAGAEGAVEPRIEIPAPRQLKVAAGHGKVEVYAIDDKGERSPLGLGNRGGPFRTAEREVRWAVITGVFDHHKVRESLIGSGWQLLPRAEEIYRRVELERQTRRGDGSWSGWGRTDIEAVLRILDQLPVMQEERVAEPFLVDGLVDPLPWLTDGKWRGVDVEEFLPGERRGGVDHPAGQARGVRPPRDRPPALMLRTFDFKVEAGRTYRYRARVVLFNPRRQRQGPGAHQNRRLGPRELFGPWSDATDAVTIPAS
jgi:RNA polymerase sigma factor (sigma-70 family)